MRTAGHVVLVLLCAACHVAGQTRQIVLPVVAHGPELRGDMSDAAWQQAARVAEFVLMDTAEQPEAATEALALCDAEYLYVGFFCHEPSIEQLVTETSGLDGPVRTDDCVHVVLDIPNGKTWVYHIIVNSRGVYWDAVDGPAGVDSSYSSGAKARGAVGGDRWTCEMRIPHSGIGGGPQPGETWGINFCRSRKAGAEELSSWVQAPAGFADATACGAALFTAEHGEVTFHVLSRGGVSADVADPSLNAFFVQVRNAGRRAATASIEVSADGAPVGAQETAVAAGAAAELRVRYVVPSEGQPLYGFVASVDGREVYRSELQAVKPIYPGPKSWSVPDPLFEELLSDEAPGLRRHGALIWGHLNDVRLLRETAKRFAVHYSEDEVYQLHAEHHLIMIGHGVIRDLGTDSPFARWRVRNAPAASSQYRDFPWVLDPGAIEAGLADIEQVFTGPHPLVFGVFAGDEVDDNALKQGAQLMARPGDYQYIHEADAQVKQQFGVGRWGIPAGLAERDPDPYKWIAFRRWCNAVMRERNRRLCETVRRNAADMPIISVDGGGDLQPYEFSAQAELFDIFTNQHASRGNPWRCQLGYITKAIADITGKEVWPCAHVEHYLVSLTPEEVLEELSQVFRNGGDGLHLYLSDTGGGRKLVGDTRTCYFGSPRRWHTIMNVVDLLRTMPQPNYPDYDRTAVLFNDDTLGAVPYDAHRPYGEQTEVCYTMLGPVAGSWFRFVDCGQIIQWSDLPERFDIIYLPCARYQRPAVVDRLVEFVADGGTLVCADPQAFETDLIGNDTARRREALFGVTADAPRLLASSLTPADSGLGGALPLTGEAYRLQPGDGVEVLASYDDGSPAVTSRRLGAGRAVLFGCNPFSFAAVEDAPWRHFFAAWTGSLGAPRGLDIWRFKLPDSLIWREPEPPGLCLTNNHVLWQEETPRTHLNRDTGGSYTYSLAPDGMPDAVVEGSVPFEQGHLTDRRRAIRARKTGNTRSAPYALPASRWMVSWESAQPVTITFDLGEAYALREFRLWFCDHLPEVTVEVSPDGGDWTLVGPVQAQVAGEDVLSSAVPLEPLAPSRYLRATFSARDPGQRLTLVEAEVWGDGVGGRSGRRE